jgi:hypothetical protein
MDTRPPPARGADTGGVAGERHAAGAVARQRPNALREHA